MALLTGPITAGGKRVNGWLITYGTRYGTYCRGRTSRVKPYPDAWNTILTRRTFLAGQWRTVATNAQKTDWAAYAAAQPWAKESGRVVTLNGFQLFTAYNLTALRLGRAVNLNAPTSHTLLSHEITSFSYPVPGFIQVSVRNSDPWTTDPDAVLILIERGYTTPQNRTRKSFGRMIGSVPGVPIIGLPFPLLFPRPYPADTPPSETILGRIWHAW